MPLFRNGMEGTRRESLLRLRGEPERFGELKCRSGAGLAFQPYLTAHFFGYQSARYGEARAAEAARHRTMGLSEGFEKSRRLFHRYADAGQMTQPSFQVCPEGGIARLDMKAVVRGASP